MSEHPENSAKNPTFAYVYAFIDEIQRAGIQNIVICPGSRSTPLAMTGAAHPAIHTWMHIDERSAAYFALGMAKRLRKPVALLCTSGTAAANFLPAITEAHLTHIPLLILTADRPHELRDCGAPQAIDQNHIYGKHTKWFVDVALPEASNAALRYIRTIADRACALTRTIPAGPVHLNFPLREPLTPEARSDQPLPEAQLRDPLAWNGRPGNHPYITVDEAPLAPPGENTLVAIAERLRAIPHGLIIAGPNDIPALDEPLIRLAERLSYPILADPLSQLRNGKHTSNHIITSYDAFLRNAPFIAHHQPEIILRVGAMPTAKPLHQYLKRYGHCRQIIIDGQHGWDEPTQLASDMLYTEPRAFCQAVTDIVANTADPSRDQWLQAWQQADRITRQTLLANIQEFPELFEGRIFTELAELLPPEATLFAGNSMPIRDMDTFFWKSRHPIWTVGNRGANGIDGVVSSALGTSVVTKTNGPTVLVIGDLSFFHDLNGLLAAHLHHLNIVIVLINNDGGGIFSFLSQAAYPDHFEQLFGTPIGLDFAPVVHMYGGTFTRCSTWQDFRQAMQHGCHADGLHVVEICTNRENNVIMHRQLWQHVDNALEDQEK